MEFDAAGCPLMAQDSWGFVCSLDDLKLIRHFFDLAALWKSILGPKMLIQIFSGFVHFVQE